MEAVPIAAAAAAAAGPFAQAPPSPPSPPPATPNSIPQFPASASSLLELPEHSKAMPRMLARSPALCRLMLSPRLTPAQQPPALTVCDHVNTAVQAVLQAVGTPNFRSELKLVALLYILQVIRARKLEALRPNTWQLVKRYLIFKVCQHFGLPQQTRALQQLAEKQAAVAAARAPSSADPGPAFTHKLSLHVARDVFQLMWQVGIRWSHTLQIGWTLHVGPTDDEHPIAAPIMAPVQRAVPAIAECTEVKVEEDVPASDPQEFALGPRKPSVLSLSPPSPVEYNSEPSPASHTSSVVYATMEYATCKVDDGPHTEASLSSPARPDCAWKEHRRRRLSYMPKSAQ